MRVYILSITKVRSWDYSIDTFARFVLLYMYLKSSNNLPLHCWKISHFFTRSLVVKACTITGNACELDIGELHVHDLPISWCNRIPLFVSLVDSIACLSLLPFSQCSKLCDRFQITDNTENY